jgi:signal transduction histidine kinase
LRAALEVLIERMRAQGLSCDLIVSGDEGDYNRSTLVALYRAAQEGLTNVQRHAGASRVVLELSFEEQAAWLRLQDDGRGFDTTQFDGQSGSVAAGFGLQGIRERLELVRGQVEIRSDPGWGTELTMVAPKHPVVLASQTHHAAQLAPAGASDG